jgi:GH43 family beta-xylosidase
MIMKRISFKSKMSELIISLILIILMIPFDGCGKENTQKLLLNGSEVDTCFTYTNPVGKITNIGDPYVLQYGGQYYLYATSSSIGFKVWESPNLVDWEPKGLALNSYDSGNNWGKGNFWAPEVKFFKGEFYMVYSAIGDNGKMKIRIARSDNPLGPFINWSPPFLETNPYSYIDGDMFIDGNRVYLYFVKDCSENIVNGKHVSQIYVAELNDQLTNFISDPKIILSPDQQWEGLGSDWMWNEGPFVMKHENTYYLLYSANFYASPDYSIGVATANSPMGTWTKYSENPILKKNVSLQVSGPGHCMVTMSPDNSEFFIVYHTHTYFDHPSGNRNVCIDRFVFINGIPKVIGPTRSPQTLPSGEKYRLINTPAPTTN